MTLRVALVLLSFGTIIPACGDDGGGGSGSSSGGDEAPTMARVQAEIFDLGCSVKSCHSSTARSGDLILEAGKSHAQLVDVPAYQVQAMAEGKVRVVPGDADASFLLTKCTAPLDAAYGDVMPWGNDDGLGAEELALLRAWIDAGAPAE